MNTMSFRVILQNNGQTVRKTHTRKSRRLYHILRGQIWQTAELTVRYYANDVLVGDNRGVYDNEAKFIQALTAFTDAEIFGNE
jgi:hypothetical protein